MQHGEARAALDILEPLLEERSDHRAAALAASVAATMLGDHELAEFFARLGCRHHPADAMLWHHLGLALMRQERLEESREALQRALENKPAQFISRFVLALMEIRVGRRHEAIELLSQAGRYHGQENRDLARLVGRIQQGVRIRRVAGVLGFLGVSLSVWLVVIGNFAGWPLMLFSLLVSGGLLILAHHQGRIPKSLSRDPLVVPVKLFESGLEETPAH